MSTPSFFQKPQYRYPNDEELKEIDKENLKYGELLKGFNYAIVGRGFRSPQAKTFIINSIKKLLDINPKNKNYKIAFDEASESRLSLASVGCTVSAGTIYVSSQSESNKMPSITVETSNPEKLTKILDMIKTTGNVGHSFSIVIDPDDQNSDKRTFGWDGDGSDRIGNIEINKDSTNIEDVENSDDTENVEAGKLSTLFGTAALALLSMVGSISGAQKDSDKYLDIKSQLIEMQEAKSQEVLDVVYYDLVKDLGKISGSDRNKLVKQAEKVHKEMVKHLK